MPQVHWSKPWVLLSGDDSSSAMPAGINQDPQEGMQAFLLPCCFICTRCKCLANAWEAPYSNSQQSYTHHHHLATHAATHMPHKRISNHLRMMPKVQSDSLLAQPLALTSRHPPKGSKGIHNCCQKMLNSRCHTPSHQPTTPYVCVSANPSHVRLS